MLFVDLFQNIFFGVLSYWNHQFIILEEDQRFTLKQSIFSVYNGAINTPKKVGVRLAV